MLKINYQEFFSVKFAKAKVIVSKRYVRAAAVAALSAGALTSFFVFSALPPPAIPLINLSSEPLYSKSASKPTLVLALSVEFPTVGAQYTVKLTSSVTSDDTYSLATEYIGYFDANSCYTYANDSDPNLRRFTRYGAAVVHGCAGAGFSGNFMNWASSSAIDILRLGLTGGDRIVDNSSMTVLQRAVLRNGGFYNDSNFPPKKLVQTLVAQSVPSALSAAYNGDIWISNCLNRMHFGTASTGNCNAPGNNSNLGVTGGVSGTAILSADNFFYTRVQVCELSGGNIIQPRPGYCLRYPNGNYKPIGNLQKYSENIRVAAFGYLMDDSPDRYGGVLRASMKYVGPKNYDANGVLLAGTNPRLEWDESTGVFVANPEAAVQGNSGVVNYLNKFGRTGASTGVYKTYDPVGELYYEALRYIQGLQPTPEAVSGINSAMLDGFQVFDTWVDPHAGGSASKNYSCLNNNILLVGDDNTHFDKSIPGFGGGNGDFARGVDVAGNVPNFVEWTHIVGEFEAGRSASYVDGHGVARLTSNPNPDFTNTTNNFHQRDRGNLGTLMHGDYSGYYMAGMAYWARTHDIRGSDWTSNSVAQRPGMRAKTFMLDVNEYGDQNNSDTRRENAFFLASKYGGFDRDPAIDDSGNPYLNQFGVLDNSKWSEALVGPSAGEAKSYFLSSSGQSVLTALDKIFIDISAQANSVAGGAASSPNITTASTDIYVAKFAPEKWSGDLQRYQLSQAGANANVNLIQPTNINQSAAQQLDAVTTVIASRNIVVGRTARPISSNYATNFINTAIEPALTLSLAQETPASTPDGLAARRLAFLRGDRVDEGGVFRLRASRLGDIVNSGAVYSGAPTQNINEPGYQAFYSSNAARTAAVFVGANDGMLHGFNAANMKELFAYIPSWVTPNLGQLTAPTYNSNHTSYVDATPVVAEAQVGASWKTVLVSGTGAGGQGVFALDVTNPAAFNPSKVMWEFTDRDDVDMGNVIGKPQVLKFRTSLPGDAPVYKWFAVVPSGVNNYKNDGYYSATGMPALFLLSLEKPSATPWQLGSNYYKVSLPITPSVATLMGTGLVNFSPTFGNANEVEKIYAPDLHGNIWRFSFDLQGSINWSANKLSEFKNGSGAAVPFYSAKDGLGKEQPITMAPMLTYGPSGSLLVSFGTGKYLEESDNIIDATTQKQSVYVLYDNNKTTTLDTSGGSSYINGRGRLKAGAVTGAVIAVPPFEFGRPMTDGATERAGWYIDFPSAGSAGGERQISDFESYGNTIVFNSILPPNASVNACGSGSGALYLINLATGTGTARSSTLGILGKPIIFESSDDTTFSTTDALGRMTKTTNGVPISIGQNGVDTGGKIPLTTIAGRLSWRQVNNYQELKAAP